MSHPLNEEPNGPLQRRRALRKRSTKPEQLLWQALRNRKFHGLKFRRRHPIDPFIVDFVCIERKTVVGISHFTFGTHMADPFLKGVDLYTNRRGDPSDNLVHSWRSARHSRGVSTLVSRRS